MKGLLERLFFLLKTGHDLHVANNGKPVDEVVIRYKEFYLCIFTDLETGEPTGDFSWSREPMMFHVPVREHYTAERKVTKCVAMQ